MDARRSDNDNLHSDPQSFSQVMDENTDRVISQNAMPSFNALLGQREQTRQSQNTFEQDNVAKAQTEFSKRNPISSDKDDPSVLVNNTIASIQDLINKFINGTSTQYNLFITIIGNIYKMPNFDSDDDESVEKVDQLQRIFIFWVYLEYLKNNNDLSKYDGVNNESQAKTNLIDKFFQLYNEKYKGIKGKSMDSFIAKCNEWYDNINFDEIKTGFDNIFVKNFKVKPEVTAELGFTNEVQGTEIGGAKRTRKAKPAKQTR